MEKNNNLINVLIGKELKIARLQKRITQTQVGEYMGVSRQMVSMRGIVGCSASAPQSPINMRFYRLYSITVKGIFSSIRITIRITATKKDRPIRTV